MRHLDQAVTDAGGIALRYGGFYGAANDGLLGPVRKRQFPIVGNGGGVFSFIHLDDAAAATVLALEHDGAGIYNIVDDEPAPVREWLPVLADALGAKPPRHVPRWLARLVAGEGAVHDGNRVPRRLEREGQAGARVDAALPELAAGLHRGLRPAGTAPGPGVTRQDRHTIAPGCGTDGRADRPGLAPYRRIHVQVVSCGRHFRSVISEAGPPGDQSRGGAAWRDHCRRMAPRYYHKKRS